jgi:hypothetical protein
MPAPGNVEHAPSRRTHCFRNASPVFLYHKKGGEKTI